MKISRATLKDALGIRECIQVAFKEQIERTGVTPPRYDDLTKIKQHIIEHNTWVVREKGQVIAGYICYCRCSCLYLSKIFVHPEHQRKGLGRELLEHFEKQNGYFPYFTLHTEADNVANAQFYTRMGYQCTNEEVLNDVVLSFYVKPWKED